MHADAVAKHYRILVPRGRGSGFRLPATVKHARPDAKGWSAGEVTVVRAALEQLLFTQPVPGTAEEQLRVLLRWAKGSKGVVARELGVSLRTVQRWTARRVSGRGRPSGWHLVLIEERVRARWQPRVRARRRAAAEERGPTASRACGDHRTTRTSSPTGRSDERVVAAVREALRRRRGRSRGTINGLFPLSARPPFLPMSGNRTGSRVPPTARDAAAKPPYRCPVREQGIRG
ncbi:helix-turn-helix domain-containing protein [Streptomyces erythrochromogenes]|nr:helix-turn-helix domain-containing protein [Streptomyces erythrochromogenes]